MADERPLDDSEHNQIEQLKDQIKTLSEIINQMSMAQQQINKTELEMVGKILQVKEIADTANQNVAKTKADLGATLEAIQKNTQTAFGEAFQKGMAPFAEEIKKSTQAFVDSRITQILGNQGAAAEPELDENGQPIPGHPMAQRPAMVPQQAGAGGLLAGVDLSQLINAIATKFLAPPAAPPPMQVGDMFAMFLKFDKLMGDLADVRKDLNAEKIEAIRKQTNDSFKTPAA
jgi:hypothetical protein